MSRFSPFKWSVVSSDGHTIGHHLFLDHAIETVYRLNEMSARARDSLRAHGIPAATHNIPTYKVVPRVKGKYRFIPPDDLQHETTPGG